MNALTALMLLAAIPFPVQSAAVFLGLQLGLPLTLADMSSYAWWVMRVDPTTPACVTASSAGAWRGYVVKLVFQGTVYWVFSGTQPSNIAFLCVPPTLFPQPKAAPTVTPAPSGWPWDDRVQPSMADPIVVFCNNDELSVYLYDGTLLGKMALSDLKTAKIGDSIQLRFDATLVRNDTEILTVYWDGAWKAFPLALCLEKDAQEMSQQYRRLP